MNVTFTIEGNNRAELAKGIRAHLELFENTTAHEETAKPAKRAAKEAQPMIADPVEEETAGGDVFDLGEEAEEEKAPVVTRSDMMKALSAHPDKSKVTKLLQTKFKIKNINELKETQYGDVIAAVSKLK